MVYTPLYTSSILIKKYLFLKPLKAVEIHRITHWVPPFRCMNSINIPGVSLSIQHHNIVFTFAFIIITYCFT